MPILHRLRRLGALLLAAALVVVGAARVGPRAAPAAAAVVHGDGYRATVHGFTSWYGSYQLAGIGTAWCIDHGIRAPDADLAYAPTDLAEVPAATKVALGWMFGRWGTEPDRVTGAALMLAAHDLMGATYPYGELDLASFGVDRLAGFGGDEAAVLARGHELVADALAHADLRPPWALELTADEPAPGATGVLTARLTAGGVPAVGIDLRASATGTRIGGPDAEAPISSLLTGPDGVATAPFLGAAGPYELRVEATLPDLVPQAFAPTAAPAQRVVRPATVPVVATVQRAAPATTTAPTSTTTAAPTTTTTALPTTTTTSPPPTTTTVPPTTTTAPTTTTVPPTTSTTPPPTTTPPSSTPGAPSAPSAPTTLSAPIEVLPAATTAPTLPRTGIDPVGLACTGTGLVLLGWSVRRRAHA